MKIPCFASEQEVTGNQFSYAFNVGLIIRESQELSTDVAR